jgi:hypothetical protein
LTRKLTKTKTNFGYHVSLFSNIAKQQKLGHYVFEIDLVKNYTQNQSFCKFLGPPAAMISAKSKTSQTVCSSVGRLVKRRVAYVFVVAMLPTDSFLCWQV